MSFGIPIRNGLSLGLRPVATLATDLSSFDPGPPWIVLTSSGIAYLVYQVVQDSSGTAYTVPFLVKSSDGVDYYIAPYEPSLYLDYTIPSSGVPGVQPGCYLVDDVSGNLTKTTFSSLITFSRASNATRFSPTGQLQYAPHNLLLQSQDYSATWTVTSLTPATGKTAPNGTSTATEFTSTAANAVLTQGYTAVAGSYTFSVYLRRVTGTGDIQIAADNGTWATKTITGTWARYDVTQTVAAGSKTAGVRVVTNTDVIEVWGAQLAVGPNALDYTPTTTAVVYGPRFDYDPTTLAAKGLLIEEQRTNSIRNNTMVGAVAGTPGTNPTNWAIATSIDGLTKEIVGVGVQNGVNYIDIRLYGTSGTLGSVTAVSFDSNTQIAASNGQTWTGSSWVAIVAGNTTNVNALTLRTRFNDVAGANLTFSDTSLLAATATMQRIAVSSTASNASTSFVNMTLVANFADNSVVDITLRIGLPQLEQGAFATSVIPTTTAATTRSADVASIGTLSPWYNAAEGTLYAEFQWETTYARNNSSLFRFDDGTNNNLIQLGFRNVSPTAPGSISSRLSAGATAETTTGTVPTNDGLRHKFAGAYAALELAFSADAQAAGTAVITGVPTVNIARLGASNTGIATQYAIYIRRITYTPRRLTNAELQSLAS